MQTVRYDDVNSLDVKACGIENEKIPRVFTRTSTLCSTTREHLYSLNVFIAQFQQVVTSVH